jgi:hypothetical protein
MKEFESKKPTSRWWAMVLAALSVGVLVQVYRNVTGEELPGEFQEQLIMVLVVAGPTLGAAAIGWLAPKDGRLKRAIEELTRLQRNGTVEPNEPEMKPAVEPVEPDPKATVELPDEELKGKPKTKRGKRGPVQH